MTYPKGLVVLVPFPFADRLDEKIRPAVVLNSEVYERATGEIVVALLTSKPQSGPFTHELAAWKAAGLRKPTWMRARITTVSARRVLHVPGMLAPADFDAVERIVQTALPCTKRHPPA